MWFFFHALAYVRTFIITVAVLPANIQTSHHFVLARIDNAFSSISL
jgi:hypothetical protein